MLPHRRARGQGNKPDRGWCGEECDAGHTLLCDQFLQLVDDLLVVPHAAIVLVEAPDDAIEQRLLGRADVDARLLRAQPVPERLIV